MGGATSSTSKCVIIAPASVPDHDVDYLYGQVSIDTPFVDWSGNCGNLSAAVGAFAIGAGLVAPERIPRDGTVHGAHLAGQHSQDHHRPRPHAPTARSRRRATSSSTA